MSQDHANPITEGDSVEVINCGSRMEYYGAIVISLVEHGRYTIRYTYLMKEDVENNYLEEEVPMAMMMPFPEAIPQWEYKLGEIVDGWFIDGWWLGRIIAKVNGQYVIHYEDRSQHTYSFQHVRLHQEWSREIWMFAKLNADY